MYNQIKKTLFTINKDFESTISTGLILYYQNQSTSALAKYADTNDSCIKALSLIDAELKKRPQSKTLTGLKITWLQKKVQLFRNIIDVIKNFGGNDTKTTKSLDNFNTRLTNYENKVADLMDGRIFSKLDPIIGLLNEIDGNGNESSYVTRKRTKNVDQQIKNSKRGIKLICEFFGENYQAYNVGENWQGYFEKLKYYLFYNRGRLHEVIGEYERAIRSYKAGLKFLNQNQNNHSFFKEMSSDNTTNYHKEKNELKSNIKNCKKRKRDIDDENNHAGQKSTKIRKLR